MAPGGRGPAALAGALGLVLVTSFVVVAPARAQVGSVGAEAGISRSFPPAGLPDSTAGTYLEAGADLSLPVGRGQLFANARGGLSLAGETAGDWVVGSLGGRWMFPLSGGLFAGGTVMGQGFTVTRPTLFSAVTARVHPELQWRGDHVTVSLRGRGAFSRTEIDTTDAVAGDGGSPGLPGPGGATTTATTVASERGQLGGEARVRFDAGPGAVWLQGRSVDGDFGMYRSAGLGGTVVTGPLSWNASLSYWDTPAGGEVVGGASVSLSLGGGWFASSDGRRRQPDPLLAIPPSADLSGTVRREFTFVAGARPSVYEIGGRTGDGQRVVVFRIHRPDAEEVQVIGGFSDWTPVEMERTDGTWTARIPVSPGVHHFGFRVDGEWFVPERASGVVSDDWGRQNATLVVPESESDG